MAVSEAGLVPIIFFFVEHYSSLLIQPAKFTHYCICHIFFSDDIQEWLPWEPSSDGR